MSLSAFSPAWVLAAALACALASDARAAAERSPRTIYVKTTPQLTFEPRELTISAGDTVVWVNPTDRTHSVTADPGRALVPIHAGVPEGAATFDSGPLPPGAQFSHTFQIPGTYRYFCAPHELADMTGSVVVESSP